MNDYMFGIACLAERLVQMAIDDKHYGDLDIVDVVAAARELGAPVDEAWARKVAAKDKRRRAPRKRNAAHLHPHWLRDMTMLVDWMGGETMASIARRFRVSKGRASMVIGRERAQFTAGAAGRGILRRHDLSGLT